MITPRPNLTSPKELRELLQRYDVRPSKRLGQSFLIDANIVAIIADAAQVGPDDRVFEVGPGAGALTTALAEHAGRVVALELDRRLVDLLTATLGDAPNVRIVQGNILRTDLRSLLGGGPWKLLANLPYSITGPALARFMEERSMFPLMVLMLQREVADRLTAAPGTKQYGVLSILVQAHMQVEVVKQVSRSCFYPQPEVDSTVLRLSARAKSAVEDELEPLFVAVVRAVFRQRRKTMLNALAVAAELNLTREDAARVLAQAEVDPGRRPGSLSPEEFAAVARAAQPVCGKVPNAPSRPSQP
jgi:16S rRNA (adenine1518-N6/adenine1519-N6)-dimethyltransferase